MKKKLKKLNSWSILTKLCKTTVLESTIPFHVIFRNGVPLRGYPKLGTARTNCEIDVKDYVVTGTFGWQPKKVKSKRKAVRRGKK